MSFFLSEDGFHLRVPCQSKRCGTVVWRCCRATWPASLNQSWAPSISVLLSWEWPSSSYTREWRSNLLNLRMRSVWRKMHRRKTALSVSVGLVNLTFNRFTSTLHVTYSATAVNWEKTLRLINFLDNLTLFVQDVKYLAISGFFFLRFFAPAILTPKLFQLRDQHADTRTSRTLLLLAKVR